MAGKEIHKLDAEILFAVEIEIEASPRDSGSLENFLDAGSVEALPMDQARSLYEHSFLRAIHLTTFASTVSI